MARATQAQYDTVIENFRRQACEHRARAAGEREGSWQQRADLRCAEKADQQADDMERMKVLRAERDARIAA